MKFVEHPNSGKRRERPDLVAKAAARAALRSNIVDRLVDAAIATCEPENADEKTTAYTRQALGRKFREILKAQRQ